MSILVIHTYIAPITVVLFQTAPVAYMRCKKECLNQFSMEEEPQEHVSVR